MNLHFIDRIGELGSLEKWHSTDRFEMVIIYGRRRVGKTYIIKKLLEKHPGFYFLCDRSGTNNNLKRLKTEFCRHISEPTIETNDIDDIFRYIARKCQNRTVLVLDEFTYLIEKDPAFPSIFQRIVDEIIPDSNIMLILCGSSISMMEEGVLSGRSPLYGRRSGSMRIEPVPFKYLHEFLPHYDLEELVRTQASLGSIPYHLASANDDKDLKENLETMVLMKDGRLYMEVDFLLKQELREPDVYKKILFHIAHGSTRVSGIASKSSIQRSDLPKYLNKLISLGLIRKEFSFNDRKESRPHYSISDNLTNFWFTFCEPYKSDLELGVLNAPISKLKKNFNTYIGKRFEELVRYELVRKVLPFHPSKIARYWNRETEIDIVATDDTGKKGIFIEVKWSKIDSQKELKLLERKVEEFPWEFKDVSMMIIGKELTQEHHDCMDLNGLLERNDINIREE